MFIGEPFSCCLGARAEIELGEDVNFGEDVGVSDPEGDAETVNKSYLLRRNILKQEYIGK